MTRKDLERAAVDAHHRGDTWAKFWPTIAADVSRAEPSDYYARGRLVHRLMAIVASGDTGGMVPPQDGYGRPMDFELEQVQ